ncbi:MAG: hypothetical protein R3F59_38480 [Myxococcota bacterium]
MHHLPRRAAPPQRLRRNVAAALAPRRAPAARRRLRRHLGEALHAVEHLNSDRDGYDNLSEIQAGTAMADPASFQAPAATTATTA